MACDVVLFNQIQEVNKNNKEIDDYESLGFQLFWCVRGADSGGSDRGVQQAASAVERKNCFHQTPLRDKKTGGLRPQFFCIRVIRTAPLEPEKL